MATPGMWIWILSTVSIVELFAIVDLWATKTALEDELMEWDECDLPSALECWTLTEADACKAAGYSVLRTPIGWLATLPRKQRPEALRVAVDTCVESNAVNACGHWDDWRGRD
jgi:hypothetical protein